MTSNPHIYPYVYKCTHKKTGEYYIGARYGKIKLPAEQDLPLYKTSSKVVKPRFDEFDWFIIAEFFSGEDAYWFEQDIIKENWKHPLLLNKRYHDSQRGLAFKAPKMTEERKIKIGLSNSGKPRSPEWRAIISKYHKGKSLTEEHKKKISLAHLGKPCKPRTPEQNLAISLRQLGVKRGPYKKKQ